MDDKNIGAGLDERSQIAVWRVRPSSEFPAAIWCAAQPLDHHRAHAQVGHEVTIHDVDMQALRPARSTSATCSPRRLKSAAKIDGAMVIIFLTEMLYPRRLWALHLIPALDLPLTCQPANPRIARLVVTGIPITAGRFQ